MSGRRAVAALLGAAIAALVAASLGGAAVAKPGKPPPERLMVRGVEFDLLLSKRKLVPGRVVIQFVNAGEDAHDLRIAQLGVPEGEFGFSEIAAGEYESLGTRLRRATTYALWCSLADHRARGMETTLRTKKRRR